MADFENELYSNLRDYVDGKVSGVRWTTVPEPVPVVLPTIAFEVSSMPVDMEHVYDEIGEFVCPKIMVRASVNNSDKIEAKRLLSLCDEYLASIGFFRSFGPAREEMNGVLSLYSLYDDNIVQLKTGRIFKR